MKMNPRDPLHRPRSNQGQEVPEKELPSGETSIPKVPKSNVPEYGDKPEQVPQVNGRRQKREKSVI